MRDSQPTVSSFNVFRELTLQDTLSWLLAQLRVWKKRIECTQPEKVGLDIVDITSSKLRNECHNEHGEPEGALINLSLEKEAEFHNKPNDKPNDSKLAKVSATALGRRSMSHRPDRNNRQTSLDPTPRPTTDFSKQRLCRP